MFKNWLEEKLSPAQAGALIKASREVAILINFVKRDGTTRVMKAMYGIRPENPTGAGMTYDPESRGMILVNDRDVAKEKGTDAAFRTVPLNRLNSITVGEKTYTVDRPSAK